MSFKGKVFQEQEDEPKWWNSLKLEFESNKAELHI